MAGSRSGPRLTISRPAPTEVMCTRSSGVGKRPCIGGEAPQFGFARARRAFAGSRRGSRSVIIQIYANEAPAQVRCPSSKITPCLMEGFCCWIDARAAAFGDRHSRAQPEAGRGLRAHRSPMRRALSRNVRPLPPAPLGQLGQRGRMPGTGPAVACKQLSRRAPGRGLAERTLTRLAALDTLSRGAGEGLCSHRPKPLARTAGRENG